MSHLHLTISGKGPPLILLHGWGWHSGIWDSLLPQLQNKYEVFAIDLPGFGKSPLLTSSYTFDEIIPYLLAVVPDQAAWLGWSLGGLFALWIAIYFPSHVSRLITVTSSPCFVAGDDWPGVSSATLEKFSTLLKQDYKKTLLDFLALQLRGCANQDELFSQLQPKLFIENKDLLAGLAGGLNLLRDTDLRKQLSEITCPTLHIFGQRDMIVPASLAPYAFTSIHKSHSYVMKRTGHMPFLTHPEMFLDSLAHFINDESLPSNG